MAFFSTGDELCSLGEVLAPGQIYDSNRYTLYGMLHRIGVEPIDLGVARDSTPEAIRPLLDKEISGFGEMFRAISHEEIGTSTLQSRAFAGVANGTFIFCLPGSSGACKTGWDKLIQAQLDYRTRPCNLIELMPRLAADGGGKAHAND